MRPVENLAAREHGRLLACGGSTLANLERVLSDTFDSLIGTVALSARQLRDRVVRDEHAVVGPALNLLDLQGELNTHLAEERLGCTDLTRMMRLCHDD